jgi:hypothetical protein
MSDYELPCVLSDGTQVTRLLPGHPALDEFLNAYEGTSEAGDSSMSDDLITWLRDQLDDDERVARAADSGRWLPEDKGITFEYYADDFPDGEAQARLVADTRANQWHIASWDPARVLAEVDAKRRILDEYEKAFDRRRRHREDLASAGALLEMVSVVKLLALPYADRPGYREEWRP